MEDRNRERKRAWGTDEETGKKMDLYRDIKEKEREAEGERECVCVCV